MLVERGPDPAQRGARAAEPARRAAAAAPPRRTSSGSESTPRDDVKPSWSCSASASSASVWWSTASRASRTRSSSRSRVRSSRCAASPARPSWATGAPILVLDVVRARRGCRPAPGGRMSEPERRSSAAGATGLEMGARPQRGGLGRTRLRGAPSCCASCWSSGSDDAPTRCPSSGCARSCACGRSRRSRASPAGVLRRDRPARRDRPGGRPAPAPRVWRRRSRAGADGSSCCTATTDRVAGVLVDAVREVLRVAEERSRPAHGPGGRVGRRDSACSRQRVRLDPRPRPRIGDRADT